MTSGHGEGTPMNISTYMANRPQPPLWLYVVALFVAIAINLGMLAGAIWLAVYVLRCCGVGI